MKIKDLKNNRLVDVFQYYWVDEGDECKPGNRMQGNYIDGKQEVVSLDPGEYKHLDEHAVAKNEWDIFNYLLENPIYCQSIKAKNSP